MNYLFLVYIWQKVKIVKLCPEFIFQSPPGLSPVDLFGHIVKPSVIPGSNQSGFGNGPAYLWPLSFHSSQRPTFLCSASSKIPGSDTHAFSFPLFQGWAGDNFLKSYFNARGNKGGMSAKSNISCWAFSVAFSKFFSSFRKSSHFLFLFLGQQRVQYEARDRDFLWNIFHRLTISWKLAGGSEMHSWVTTPCMEALISKAGGQSQRHVNRATFYRESGRRRQRCAKGKQKL